MEMPPKLKEYIDNHRGSLPPVTDPDEPLQLDSLNVIRMVAFLENDLGYRVEDEELIAENFETLRALSQLLASKTPTAPTGEAKPPGAEPLAAVLGNGCRDRVRQRVLKYPSGSTSPDYGTAS